MEKSSFHGRCHFSGPCWGRTGTLESRSFVAVVVSWAVRSAPTSGKKKGEVFLLTVGGFLLTVELLCLQSLKALMRRTFPL